MTQKHPKKPVSWLVWSGDCNDKTQQCLQRPVDLPAIDRAVSALSSPLPAGLWKIDDILPFFPSPSSIHPTRPHHATIQANWPSSARWRKARFEARRAEQSRAALMVGWLRLAVSIIVICAISTGAVDPPGAVHNHGWLACRMEKISRSWMDFLSARMRETDWAG